jgi:hypothetical protein
MEISARDRGSKRRSRRVRVGFRSGGFGRDDLARQIALLIALGQDGDCQIGAEAFTQAATNAVGRFDDGVVGQDETGLGADLDADVAALTPLVGPSDVDVVDDGGRTVRSLFSGVWRARGCTPG